MSLPFSRRVLAEGIALEQRINECAMLDGDWAAVIAAATREAQQSPYLTFLAAVDRQLDRLKAGDLSLLEKEK